MSPVTRATACFPGVIVKQQHQWVSTHILLLCFACVYWRISIRPTLLWVRDHFCFVLFFTENLTTSPACVHALQCSASGCSWAASLKSCDKMPLIVMWFLVRWQSYKRNILCRYKLLHVVMTLDGYWSHGTYSYMEPSLHKTDGNNCMRVTSHTVDLKQASKHTHTCMHSHFLRIISVPVSCSEKQLPVSALCDCSLFIWRNNPGRHHRYDAGVGTVCRLDCKVQPCETDLLQKAAAAHPWGRRA